MKALSLVLLIFGLSITQYVMLSYWKIQDNPIIVMISCFAIVTIVMIYIIVIYADGNDEE